MKLQLPGFAQRGVLAVRQKSPQILMVAGAVGFVGTIIAACKATRKIDKVLEEHNEKIEELKASENNTKKEITKTYVQTGMSLAKLYAPAFALGVLSLSSFLGAHKILKKRYIGVSAALASVTKAYDDYRQRVKEKYGEEEERKIRLGIDESEIEVTTSDEKGKEKTVKEKIVTASGLGSGYARIFNKTNREWSNDKTYMNAFFNLRQASANDMLKLNQVDGVCSLTLNEVYDLLGFKRTLAGMRVGWVFDLRNPSGDNYIQFDIVPIEVDGEEAYMIDFNVDGEITSEIAKRREKIAIE